MSAVTSTDTRRELARSIEQTFRLEALANERKIAAIRLFALAAGALFDTLSYFMPQRMLGVPSLPASLPLGTTAAALVALGVLIVLRRDFYPRWLGLALPALDALIILSVFFNALGSIGDARFMEIGGLATVALAAALLAVTGCLRLSRRGAMLTTAMAVGIFAYFALRLVPNTPNFAIQIALLAVTGLLAIWMTAIVARATESTLGRLTLARFLPSGVIDQAHRDPLALIATPRSVEATVLVSDLRDFTAFAEPLSPPEVLGFLNEVQGRLAEIVREHGGTVDKFMGDGMLAVFGAPEPLPEHRSRALAAALAMLEAIEAINGPRLARGEPTTRLGVGIHSGPVVIGCLGSGSRLEFTVLGDTVNTAARLESLTKERKVAVLASAETLRAVLEPATTAVQTATAAHFRPEGPVQLRGRQASLQVYAVPRRALER